eukprot:932604-Pyramimonas_sp.AAC.2
MSVPIDSFCHAQVVPNGRDEFLTGGAFATITRKERQGKQRAIQLSKLVKDGNTSLRYVKDGTIPLPPEARPLRVKRVADWTIGT